MQTLTEVASHPSAMDSPRNYMGAPLDEFSNLYVVLTRQRDSNCLTESNWRTALKELGGESETVVIRRFGHWACGWWEALCVTEEKKAEGEAIETKLERYPVLDEEDWLNLETETADRCWQTLSSKERVELCQKYRINIFSARHEYAPNDPTGDLIPYLAN